jgi:ribosomal protein S18 acetylase RimI-like enzyme
MKAKTQDALRLAREWWATRPAPSYIKVHPLRDSELSTFVDVYNRCFITSPDPFCPLTLEDAEKLEPDGIFIATLWNAPAGFIACFTEKDGESVYGEITGLGVLPARRRKGVATALIQRAVEYFIAAGVEEVYCEVYGENVPSRMLITSYGFTQVGRRDIPRESSSTDVGPEHYRRGKILRRVGLKPHTQE